MDTLAPRPAARPLPASRAQGPAALSSTHLHILAVLNTQLRRLEPSIDPVRICDAGCGNGALLAYLASWLPLLNPGRNFEFHGFDVADSGVQAEGFFARTIDLLKTQHPDIDWASRLHLLTSDAAWPFKDGELHVVTSNQVLEHVGDHRHFFAETYRVLTTGGFGAHLFPLGHYFLEGHIFIPFAHWIRQHGLRRRYIELCSRLGMGSFAAHRREFGMTLATYAEEHSDYLDFMTNYLTGKELLAICKQARLRADFSFTKEWYKAKVRALLRRSPHYLYPAPHPIRDRLWFALCKRISSITLITEKRQVYAR